MTRTDQPTIEQFDSFAATVTPETEWPGTAYGINLADMLALARVGAQERNRDIEQGNEMDGLIKVPEIY